MTTASALYEVYKTLPKNTRKKFKTTNKSSFLLFEIQEGLKQVKAIREGKIKPKSIEEVL